MKKLKALLVGSVIGLALTLSIFSPAFSQYVEGGFWQLNGSTLEPADPSWTVDTGEASGAPADAKYITQTASAGLSAEQALSALSTGIVKNTTGTGVLSIMAPTGADAQVATGTAGTSGNIAMWNVDGDLVDGSVAASGLVFKRVANLPVLDDSQGCAIANGAGDVFYTVPLPGYDLNKVILSSQTAGVTGTMMVQVRNVTQGVNMLSTAATVDTGEKTSLTAATPPVVDASNKDVAEGDELRIDITGCHTTPALGVQMALIFIPQ